jgi:hybrid cluster-associated redox disulfide protein
MPPRCIGSSEHSLLQHNKTGEPADPRGSTRRIAMLFAPKQRALKQSPQIGCMKNIAQPSPELIVDEVMRRWPSTIRIFLEFNMGCVGCPIATFHSVDEACSEHGISLETFLGRLRTAASQPPVSAGRAFPSASANSP